MEHFILSYTIKSESWEIIFRENQKLNPVLQIFWKKSQVVITISYSDLQILSGMVLLF